MSRKRLVSGGVLAAIFGFLYGVWGLSDNGVIFDNHVFTLLRLSQTSTVPRALASSVWQVIAADGSYSIVNNGVTYSTNMIYDGDIIELSSDARLSFMVDGHQAYVIGPASVAIYVDGDDSYYFKVLYGQFLEVFSSQASSGSFLTVEMQDIILAHNAYENTMKVQFSADVHGDMILKNYADPVLVVNADDSSDVKDLPREAQLTIASSAAIASAIETSFSVSDITFVSDASVVIEEWTVSLLSLYDDVYLDSDTIVEGTLSLIVSWSHDLDPWKAPSLIWSLPHSGEVVMDDVFVNDLLLPTDDQLLLLRQLTTTHELNDLIPLWDRVSDFYDCSRLPTDYMLRVETIRTCIMWVMDKYHIPPSLVSSLTEWLYIMATVSSHQEYTDSISGSVVSWAIIE